MTRMMISTVWLNTAALNKRLQKKTSIYNLLLMNNVIMLLHYSCVSAIVWPDYDLHSFRHFTNLNGSLEEEETNLWDVSDVIYHHNYT